MSKNSTHAEGNNDSRREEEQDLKQLRKAGPGHRRRGKQGRGDKKAARAKEKALANTPLVCSRLFEGRRTKKGLYTEEVLH